MAEDIENNTTLQSFTLRTSGAQLGNESGVALANAIKENTTLESFTFDAFDTQLEGIMTRWKEL